MILSFDVEEGAILRAALRRYEIGQIARPEIAQRLRERVDRAMFEEQKKPK